MKEKKEEENNRTLNDTNLMLTTHYRDKKHGYNRFIRLQNVVSYHYSRQNIERKAPFSLLHCVVKSHIRNMGHGSRTLLHCKRLCPRSYCGVLCFILFYVVWERASNDVAAFKART